MNIDITTRYLLTLILAQDATGQENVLFYVYMYSVHLRHTIYSKMSIINLSSNSPNRILVRISISVPSISI